MTDDQLRVLRACQETLLMLIEEASMRIDQSLAADYVPDERVRWLGDVAKALDRLAGELGVKI